MLSRLSSLPRDQNEKKCSIAAFMIFGLCSRPWGSPSSPTWSNPPSSISRRRRTFCNSTRVPDRVANQGRRGKGRVRGRGPWRRRQDQQTSQKTNWRESGHSLFGLSPPIVIVVTSGPQPKKSRNVRFSFFICFVIHRISFTADRAAIANTRALFVGNADADMTNCAIERAGELAWSMARELWI